MVNDTCNIAIGAFSRLPGLHSRRTRRARVVTIRPEDEPIRVGVLDAAFGLVRIERGRPKSLELPRRRVRKLRRTPPEIVNSAACTHPATDDTATRDSFRGIRAIVLKTPSGLQPITETSHVFKKSAYARIRTVAGPDPS